MTSPQQHSKPVRLAHAALDAAVDQKYDRAKTLVTRISTECPGEGIVWALTAWCDAIAVHAEGGPPTPGPVQIATMDSATGKIGSTDIRPEIQWAADMVKARATADLDAFMDLVDQMNDAGDGWDRGRYAMALLDAAATSIRTLPYGYARLGRSTAGGGQ